MAAGIYLAAILLSCFKIMLKCLVTLFEWFLDVSLNLDVLVVRLVNRRLLGFVFVSHSARPLSYNDLL